ncbi:MAG: Hint domain-containing protein [Pseudooceanicola sp.]|nr:Hint domain-containing protein [Pseudooceanicola sp.]
MTVNINSIWMLEKSNITVSGGGSLDGVTQGDGSHLVGKTITLNAPNWHETFIEDDDFTFDDNDGSQKLAGQQTIDGVTYASGTKVEAEYRLTVTDPSTGQSWQMIGYNVNNSSTAYATIEGLAFVGPPGSWPPPGTPLTVTKAEEGPGGGSAQAAYAEYVTPACFTPGTRLATPSGLQAVETLRPGDRVTTLDHGAQVVRCVLATHVPAERLLAEPGLRPVTIPRGAFGADLPLRDLVLSPQHRVLRRGARCEMLFDAGEVLVAAKDLGVAKAEPWTGGVTYLHLVLDRHEVVFAEGLESESYHVGPAALTGAGAAVRAELLALFPGLEAGRVVQPAARLALRAWEARLLAA